MTAEHRPILRCQVPMSGFAVAEARVHIGHALAKPPISEPNLYWRITTIGPAGGAGGPMRITIGAGGQEPNPPTIVPCMGHGGAGRACGAMRNCGGIGGFMAR